MMASEPLEAAGGDRVALAIGNSDYRKGPALANPATDAAAIADALGRLGFGEVLQCFDLDKSGQDRELRKFAALARSADMAVIYYAGHGMEMDGENYLLPVDAELGDVSSLGFEATRLSDVMRAVEGAHRFRLVILDACRDNPFRGRMHGVEATRSLASCGLAAVEPPGNTLVAYAARHGTTAKDGPMGKNSPYAAALLNRIGTPNMDIRLVLGHVRDDVMAATGNQQQPFFYGTLGGAEIALKRVAVAPAPLPAGDQAELLRALEEERDLERALRANSIESVEAFAARWPEGRFFGQAEDKIAELKDRAEKADWAEAKHRNTVGAFESFLGKWPQSSNAERVAGKIADALKREEREAFHKCASVTLYGSPNYNDPKTLRKYLDRFADHANAEEIHKRLVEMEQLCAFRFQRDAMKSGAHDYVAFYPKGDHIEAAKSFLAGAGDDQCWIKALAATDGALDHSARKHAVKRYLEDWTEGRHADEARAKLKAIEDGETRVNIGLGVATLAAGIGLLWVVVQVAVWAIPQAAAYLPTSLDDLRKMIARQIEPAEQPKSVSPEEVLEAMRKRKAFEDALKSGSLSNGGLSSGAPRTTLDLPGAASNAPDSNGPNPFSDSTTGDLGGEAARQRIENSSTPAAADDAKHGPGHE